MAFHDREQFRKGKGVIGVWDVNNNYRRVNEFKSFGIGPRELIIPGDGRTLAVANGGMLTHPDTGRRKLNILTMNPSLVYLNSENGRLLEQYTFEQRRHQKLSIRHLSTNHTGTICIALQDLGPWRDQIPLVAFHRRGNTKLELAEAPLKTTCQLRGYMGSVTIDRSGKIAAVSAPRGGVITFWDMDTYNFLTEIDLRDGCGIAATNKDGKFLITAGSGKIIFFDALTKQKNKLTLRPLTSRP